MKYVVILVLLFKASLVFAQNEEMEDMFSEEEASEIESIEVIKEGESINLNIDDYDNHHVAADISMNCSANPKIEADFITEKSFKRSNNLSRKNGSSQRARGKYIHVKGRVLDEDCIPVQNALIKVWQTDDNGKYEDEYDTSSHWDLTDKNFDSNFAYTGVARTDNLGRFNLLTIFPGSDKESIAPYINIILSHEEFADLETRIYFNKHPKNNMDKGLINLSEEKRPLVIAKGVKLDPQNRVEGRIYYSTFVLRGVSKFKRY